jgi:hypothetical protein
MNQCNFRSRMSGVLAFWSPLVLFRVIITGALNISRWEKRRIRKECRTFFFPVARALLCFITTGIVQDRRRRAALTDRLEWPPPRFILPTPCVCVCFVFALWERDDAENCRATFNRKKKEEVGIRMKKSRFGWLRGAQIASLDILFLYITFLCGAPPVLQQSSCALRVLVGRTEALVSYWSTFSFLYF